MNQNCRGIIVGASGKQGKEYFEILNKKYRIVAVIDKNLSEIESYYADKHVGIYENLDEVLNEIDFEFAVLTLPHSEHFDYVKKLLKNKKHIIKEKPFAISSEEANQISNLVRANKRFVYTVVQRAYSESFELLKDFIKEIGTVNHFKYEYYMCFSSSTQGWRSHHKYAKGGVLLDMGYHAIDVLMRLFGKPSKVFSTLTYNYKEMADENLEDCCSIILTYGKENLSGTVTINRHHTTKDESLLIVGNEGAVEWTPSSIKLLDRSQKILRTVTFSKKSSIERMFDFYMNNLNNFEAVENELRIHGNNVSVIEEIYKTAEKPYASQDSVFLRLQRLPVLYKIMSVRRVVNE